MKINGKEVNTRYGMLAVEIFFAKNVKLSTEIKADVTVYSAHGLATIIYAGIYNYYEAKDLEVPVKFSEVYDFVENEMLSGVVNEEINNCMKEFEASQAMKKKTEDIKIAGEAVEEIKKKMLTSGSLPTNQDLNLVSTNG